MNNVDQMKSNYVNVAIILKANFVTNALRITTLTRNASRATAIWTDPLFRNVMLKQEIASASPLILEERVTHQPMGTVKRRT